MIGIDRPIRPEWIYNTLKIIEIGKNPSLYNEPFEDIAKELVGKEGKKKVRTIIFRSFIYSLQEGKTGIKPNVFIEWADKERLSDLKPLFLLKILMDYEITRFIVRKMAVNIDNSNNLSAPLLSKEMVRKYGDRDVVKRSLRAFLTTLVHFGALSRVDKNNYSLSGKECLSEGNVRNFFRLYSQGFIKSKVLDIQNIEPEFFFFFQPTDLQAVAYKFNGEDWEYIRDVNRNILIWKDIVLES